MRWAREHPELYEEVAASPQSQQNAALQDAVASTIFGGVRRLDHEIADLQRIDHDRTLTHYRGPLGRLEDQRVAPPTPTVCEDLRQHAEYERAFVQRKEEATERGEP